MNSTDDFLHYIFLPLQVRKRFLQLGTCTHSGFWRDARYVEALKRYIILTPEVGGYWWVYGGVDYPAHGWQDTDLIYRYARENLRHLIGYFVRWWFPNATVQPPDIEAWTTEYMLRYPETLDWIIVNEGYWDGFPTIPYIEDSYRIARKVRPDARLMYNGLFWQVSEQEKVKELILAGLVDGVGFQMHLSINNFLAVEYNKLVVNRVARAAGIVLPESYQTITTPEIFEPFIIWLQEHKIPWWVSELDVTIPDTSPENLLAQANAYAWVVDLARRRRALFVCTWGVADAVSWLQSQYPLPHGMLYEEKPAWNALRVW